MIAALDPATWGTAGEWVAGVGAVAVVLWYAITRRADSAAAARRAEREAAAHIHAWFRPSTGADRDSWVLVAVNRGSDPLYEWEAVAWWQSYGPPGPGIHWETVHLDAANRGPLPPGVELTQRIPQSRSSHAWPDHPHQALRVAVVWRAPSGRYWIRFGGRLHGGDGPWPQPWTVHGEPPGTKQDLDELANGLLDQRIKELDRRRWWRPWAAQVV